MQLLGEKSSVQEKPTQTKQRLCAVCDRSGLHGGEPGRKPVAPRLGTSLSLLQGWGHRHMSPDCHSYKLFSPLIPRCLIKCLRLILGTPVPSSTPFMLWRLSPRLLFALRRNTVLWVVRSHVNFSADSLIKKNDLDACHPVTLHYGESH